MSAAWILLALAATPDIARPVNDLAGVLSPETEQTLNEALEAHRRSSGVQLAVLTVDTTNGEPIADFAIRVATQWGGGAKRRDDGGLFVLAVKDHAMRIELGYGLEGRVTDATAAEVLTGARPMLRAGDFDGAVTHVIKRLVELTDLSTMTPSEIARLHAQEPIERVPQPLLEAFITLVTMLLGSALGRVARAKMDARIVDDDGPVGMSGQQVGALLTVFAVVVGTAIGMLGYGWGNYWSTGIGLTAGYMFLWSEDKLGLSLRFLGLLVVISGFLRVAGELFGKDWGIVLAAGAQAFLVYLFFVSESEGDGSSFSSSGVRDSWPSSPRRSILDDMARDPFFSRSSERSSWSGSSFGSSSSSSSSASSSSSSSSGSSDWGGGGGGFGGGGASSSW